MPSIAMEAPLYPQIKWFMCVRGTEMPSIAMETPLYPHIKWFMCV